MNRLIGLTGLKGSGRSEVARILATHKRVRIAGVLKEMLLLIGLTPDQIDGASKELPSTLLGGKTPRWAMQSLGTEWGRNLIHPDLWVNIMKARLMEQWKTNPGWPFVIDDIRFPNEVEMVYELGGVMCRVERRGITAPQDHAPENQVYNLRVDAVIHNDGSLEELRAAVLMVLQ